MMITVILLLTLVGCSVQTDVPGVGQEKTIPPIEASVPGSASQVNTDEEPTQTDFPITEPIEAPSFIEEEPPRRGTPPPFEEATESEHMPLQEGVIVGDLFFNGIELGRLFSYPFADILGSPLYIRDHHLYYDGLQLMGRWSEEYCYQDITTVLGIENLEMVKINDVALSSDINRKELLSLLGTPIDSCEVYIRYRMSGASADYYLFFWFYGYEYDEEAALRAISAAYAGLWDRSRSAMW